MSEPVNERNVDMTYRLQKDKRIKEKLDKGMQRIGRNEGSGK